MKITVSEQFQKYMQSIGIDLNETLQKAGVSQVLWKETVDLNSSEYWRLMDELDNELSDQEIINLSDIKRMNAFMPAFFAALTAKNGLEAINRLAQYKSLVGPVKLTVTDNKDSTIVNISGIDLTVEPPRFTVLTEQLMMVSLLRTGTAQEIVPLKVGSSYDYSPETLQNFGQTASNSKTNLIVFNNDDLQTSFISSNNVMWEFIRPELDRRKLEIESNKSLDDNLQALLMKKIPSGEFGIEEIAQSMNISRRTLQRNLKNLHTTFNEQVKYARQSLINPLMKDSNLSLIEISYLLGYGDPESFSRAFKSWYHQSPSLYRKQLL